MMNRRSFCISSTSIAAAIALAARAESAEGATPKKDVKAAKSVSIPMDEGKAGSIFEAYRKHAAERAALGIPPLPLNPEQVTALVFFLRTPPKGEEGFLMELLSDRVPPGVDESARIKADFLGGVASGKDKSPLISRQKATELLGTMLGGYNVRILISLLGDPAVGSAAAESLKKTILVFNAIKDVQALVAKGNANAKAVLKS